MSREDLKKLTPLKKLFSIDMESHHRVNLTFRIKTNVDTLYLLLKLDKI